MWSHSLTVERSACTRCTKCSFGRGPETWFSNHAPTLVWFDAHRFAA